MLCFTVMVKDVSLLSLSSPPWAASTLSTSAGSFSSFGLRWRGARRGALEDQNFALPRLLGKRRGPIFAQVAQAQPQLVAIEHVNPLDDADGRTVHQRDGDVDLLGVLAGVEAMEVQIQAMGPVFFAFMRMRSSSMTHISPLRMLSSFMMNQFPTMRS